MNSKELICYYFFFSANSLAVIILTTKFCYCTTIMGTIFVFFLKMTKTYNNTRIFFIIIIPPLPKNLPHKIVLNFTAISKKTTMHNSCSKNNPHSGHIIFLYIYIRILRTIRTNIRIYSYQKKIRTNIRMHSDKKMI